MERCYDNGCGYENRAEYCEQDAKDPDGHVSYVVNSIDELLYDTSLIVSGRLSAEVDDGGMYMQRSFAVSHFDSKGWILPLTRTAVSITHRINKRLNCDEYRITMGWAIERLDTISDPFLVQYAIDVYKSGDVQAEIERPDFSNDGRDRGPITAYDYEQLYEVLDLFAISHRAEGSDNERARIIS